MLAGSRLTASAPRPGGASPNHPPPGSRRALGALPVTRARPSRESSRGARDPSRGTPMKLRAAALIATVVASAAGCGSGPTGNAEKVGWTSQPVTVCAGGSTVSGVDVSEFQGSIDWNAVHGSGRGFAIARVSDGTGHPDPTFATNWAGIKNAGMVRGVYQFFRASEDPTAQANLLVSAIGTLGADDLPPVADVEVSDGVSGATLVANLATWLGVIKSKTGRTPMIYTAPGFWNPLPSTGQFAGDVLWVANWQVSCPDTPTPWTGWTFWQSRRQRLGAGHLGRGRPRRVQRLARAAPEPRRAAALRRAVREPELPARLDGAHHGRGADDPLVHRAEERRHEDVGLEHAPRDDAAARPEQRLRRRHVARAEPARRGHRDRPARRHLQVPVRPARARQAGHLLRVLRRRAGERRVVQRSGSGRAARRRPRGAGERDRAAVPRRLQGPELPAGPGGADGPRGRRDRRVHRADQQRHAAVEGRRDEARAHPARRGVALRGPVVAVADARVDGGGRRGAGGRRAVPGEARRAEGGRLRGDVRARRGERDVVRRRDDGRRPGGRVPARAPRGGARRGAARRGRGGGSRTAGGSPTRGG